MRQAQSTKSSEVQRAVIYAHYSSDEQRRESIEDQIVKCRQYCELLGWTVVGTYSDVAITGSTILRPEYQRLLQDAERGLFDVVVVEAVDRLSRRLADLAAFHDIVDFRKVKLFAADRGEINGLMVGLLGSMAQAFLEDLKGKTKRGLTGKIIAGLSAGSLGYGYKVDPDTRGKRIILDQEAGVVRRIFEDYADGAPRRLSRHRGAEHAWRAGGTLHGLGVPPGRRPIDLPSVGLRARHQPVRQHGTGRRDGAGRVVGGPAVAGLLSRPVVRGRRRRGLRPANGGVWTVGLDF